jgi:glycosyltransferase involved in cell wall biosynthesis
MFMNILQVTSEYPPVIWGGLGTAVGGLTAALSTSEDSVYVLLVGGSLLPGEQPYGSYHMAEKQRLCPDGPLITLGNIHFLHVSPGQEIAGVEDLCALWKPDIVHFHSGWLLPIAEKIRAMCGSPLVFTVHSIDKAEYEVGNFFNHWSIQENALHAADRIIAISIHEKELLAFYYPEVVHKISVAGNGIADSAKAMQCIKKRVWKASGLTVLYTGRFVERKGIMELIDAIPQVLSVFPDAVFVLVGGYGGGAEIEKAWFADGLKAYRDSVHFTGWLSPEEVSQWYENADILVVPSWYEPFGMVVLEGMLYGLPIIATNVGGPAEILAHDASALLIPARDTQALVTSILCLLQDALLRKRLGECAATQVRYYWLWDNAVKKIRQAYSDALESCRFINTA